MSRAGRVIGYSRAQALQERAALSVTFGALDVEANGVPKKGRRSGRTGWPAPTPSRPCPVPALRTGFAEALLREAFLSVRDLRTRRRKVHGLAPGEAAMGLGKLLVVAPDQEHARRYLDIVRGWIPAPQAGVVAQLATSDTPGPYEALAAFRLRAEPSVSGTVGHGL